MGAYIGHIWGQQWSMHARMHDMKHESLEQRAGTVRWSNHQSEQEVWTGHSESTHWLNSLDQYEYGALFCALY
jgi:hypothetical protein